MEHLPANKTVVITGAANGLGKALAIEFYNKGYNLALIDINFSALTELKMSLMSANQTVSIHKADISNDDEIIAVQKEINEQHKKIAILVNNADISISQPFDQLIMQDFKRLFDVNFWGTVYCTKHFLPYLKKSSDARIVNIISGFALMGFPGKTTYAASKSAIMGFTNSLKTELEGTNVKPCLVIPPPLDTGLIKNNKHTDENKKEREVTFLQKKGKPLDKTAQRIVSQVQKGKYRIIIGTMMYWMDLGSRLFPSRLHSVIGKNTIRKRHCGRAKMVEVYFHHSKSLAPCSIFFASIIH